MTTENHVGKFALNENGQLGYIVEQHVLGSQIVYTGIPVSEDSIWISLNPNIVSQKPCPGSLMDILMEVAPPNKIFGKTFGNQNFNSPSGNIHIQGANFAEPAGSSEPIDWVGFSINPQADMRDFFKFLNPGSPMKPPESEDFKIDTDDSDDEDVP